MKRQTGRKSKENESPVGIDLSGKQTLELLGENTGDMYKYFHNCHTAEDVKHQYRENAKKYHPDLGGNPEDFKAMRIEYERLWEQYKNVHRNAQGETYEKETTETPDEFADIINTLVKLNDVHVEICGSWI